MGQAYIQSHQEILGLTADNQSGRCLYGLIGRSVLWIKPFTSDADVVDQHPNRYFRVYFSDFLKA